MNSKENSTFIENKIANPLVSVIVPVFNVDKYLDECLSSICRQTLSDIEIICINDGSQDNSAEILDDFALKDGRFTVVNQKNKGLSAVRNLGTQLSRGKYIYYCDSDDFIEDDTLEQLYNRAEKDQLDVVYFSAVPFSDSENCIEELNHYKKYYKRNHDYIGTYEGIDLFNKMYANNEYLMAVCMQFIRRSFLNSKGIRFIEGIIHEDNSFTFELMLSAKRVGYVNRTFFHRRVRSGSIMTSGIKFASVYGYFRCYLHMCDFLRGLKYDDKSLFYASEQLEATIGYARDSLMAVENDANSEIERLSIVDKVLLKNLVVDEVEKCRNFKICKSDNENSLEIIDKDVCTNLNQIVMENKKLKEDLTNIKKGYSFRIGRIITFLPRKLTGRK